MTSDVAKFLDEVNELLESERYEWAHRTLASLAAKVRRSRQVTDAEHRALENIRNGIREPLGLPSEQYRSSRRYEGFPSQR